MIMTKTRFRPGKRMRASGYAARALVPTTTTTVPREMMMLLTKARPIRAVRELLKSTST